MSKHTDEARKAATELALEVWGEKKGYKDMVWLDHKIEEFATIIDQETGLPELQARIKQLEASLDVRKRICRDVVAEKAELVKALKAALPILEDAYSGQQPPPRYEIKLVKAALAKAEPESGEKEGG